MLQNAMRVRIQSVISIARLWNFFEDWVVWLGRQFLLAKYYHPSWYLFHSVNAGHGWLAKSKCHAHSIEQPEPQWYVGFLGLPAFGRRSTWKILAIYWEWIRGSGLHRKIGSKLKAVVSRFIQCLIRPIKPCSNEEKIIWPDALAAIPHSRS